MTMDLEDTIQRKDEEQDYFSNTHQEGNPHNTLDNPKVLTVALLLTLKLRICQPSNITFIIEVLGQFFTASSLTLRLVGNWRPIAKVQLIELTNGFHIAKFTTEKDYRKASKKVHGSSAQAIIRRNGIPFVSFQESRGVPDKEVLRESAQSPKPFDAHTLRSKLSTYDLKLLREHCEISPIIKLRLPDENESANMTTIDEIGVYWDMFINGFRVPLHPFFIKVLNAYGLAPGQFSPHAWRFMSFFIYQCHKLGLNPRSQRSEVCNVWLAECETRACNKLKETDLSDTDLEHIGKLKEAEPLESRYPLNNAQLCECGIIFLPEPQDFVDEEDEEEEGENNPGKALTKPWVCLIVNANMSSRAQGDPPLFNVLGVLGDIIPDELASIHGLEEEEMQDLDFGALVSGSQPKATKTQIENFVLGLNYVDKSKETSRKARSRATSSSIRLDTLHRPAWGVSVDESVFKSPRTAWDWSSHAIIPMDRKTLSGYGVTEKANGMVQLMSQAMAQVQIGAEKLIAIDKVLDEEKKKVMIENNFRREAEKKVEDLSKKLSNAGMTAKNAELSSHVNDLEAEKSSVALQAVQLFKRSKVFLDQRLRDSKGALVHGYNECKTDISKDHPELDMSIYEHKFAREVASETERRAEEAERKKAASSRALTSPSMSRSLGASGSASMAVSRPQLPLVEGYSQEMELPTDAAEQND
ncbi:hypothetical protein RJ639_044156 [Escallonia herrerae]|uniref:Transposase (putative) gypsy type domain-containing protein n=1 Tax=Escallonia herrerae TaxID=1293975 RepID=A0AA89B0V7_9ASTE|nr:hypothetical protein RJ639_044156 [Escallonia herrerae]